MIMQLIVMALGLDILIKGVEDLIHAEPSSDSLVVLSCVFTIVDGLIMLIGKSVPTGLSFSLVSAASVFFAMRGKRSHLVAYIHSMKITKASANPYGVISVTDASEDPVRNVLKKVHGATDGFYKKLTSRDMSETAYMIAVPVLFLLAFLFALISSVGQGRGESFTHSFAIMVAVTAAFPAASASPAAPLPAGAAPATFTIRTAPS